MKEGLRYLNSLTTLIASRLSLSKELIELPINCLTFYDYYLWDGLEAIIRLLPIFQKIIEAPYVYHIFVLCYHRLLCATFWFMIARGAAVTEVQKSWKTGNESTQSGCHRVWRAKRNYSDSPKALSAGDRRNAPLIDFQSHNRFHPICDQLWAPEQFSVKNLIGSKKNLKII